MDFCKISWKCKNMCKLDCNNNTTLRIYMQVVKQSFFEKRAGSENNFLLLLLVSHWQRAVLPRVVILKAVKDLGTRGECFPCRCIPACRKAGRMAVVRIRVYCISP